MSTEHDSLDRFARRLRGERDFMAHVLQTYMVEQQVDEARMADQLGLDASGLTRLALCRAPRPEPEHFAADLRAIAEYSGADLTALAQAIVLTQAIAALRQAPSRARSEAPGSLTVPTLQPGLLAARDHDTPPDEEAPATPDPGEED